MTEEDRVGIGHLIVSTRMILAGTDGTDSIRFCWMTRDWLLLEFATLATGPGYERQPQSGFVVCSSKTSPCG